VVLTNRHKSLIQSNCIITKCSHGGHVEFWISTNILNLMMSSWSPKVLSKFFFNMTQ